MQKFLKIILFWKDKTEFKLHRFYNFCILSEFLDPKHPRNRRIEDPECIRNAQNLKKNSICQNKRKGFSGGEETDSEDDVTISGLEANQQYTAADNARILHWIQNKTDTINYDEIEKIVFLEPDWLNDDCLDAFISIVQQQGFIYSIESIMFLGYRQSVEPIVAGKSVAIVAGNCTQHWRVAKFEDNEISKCTNRNSW